MKQYYVHTCIVWAMYIEISQCIISQCYCMSMNKTVLRWVMYTGKVMVHALAIHVWPVLWNSFKAALPQFHLNYNTFKLIQCSCCYLIIFNYLSIFGSQGVINCTHLHYSVNTLFNLNILQTQLINNGLSA